MRHMVAAVGVAFTVVAASLAAQNPYIRAEENANQELVITLSGGKQIVIAKSAREFAGEKQVGFRDIAVSRDGTAVGWVAYYPNCCTSYPIPHLLEVYKGGKRQTFRAAIAPWHWCFVDGSESIAAISSTVHGPQHEVIEMWDISAGTKRDQFTWMDGVAYPSAPSWVVAVRSSRGTKTHECSTK